MEHFQIIAKSKKFLLIPINLRMFLTLKATNIHCKFDEM